MTCSHESLYGRRSERPISVEGAQLHLVDLCFEGLEFILSFLTQRVRKNLLVLCAQNYGRYAPQLMSQYHSTRVFHICG